MNRKALIRQLEADFEESRKNFKEGKGIPLEEFDWGLPLHVAEPKLFNYNYTKKSSPSILVLDFSHFTRF